MKQSIFPCLLSLAVLTACNMPTKPAQITGVYTSGLKYEEYSCDRLGAELSSLARRQNQLITAQEQRYKSSMMQAFWVGFGQGDGVEASELANVKGETEAVRHAMDVKGCDTGNYDIPEIKEPVNVPQKEKGQFN